MQPRGWKQSIGDCTGLCFFKTKLEMLICFPTSKQKPLSLLALCSQSFLRTAKPSVGKSPSIPSWLTPPPKGKLIKLVIQVSFSQQLTFLLEALIKTIADQRAPKHLILDDASSLPHLGSLLIPLRSSALLQQHRPGARWAW